MIDRLLIEEKRNDTCSGIVPLYCVPYYYYFVRDTFAVPIILLLIVHVKFSDGPPASGLTRVDHFDVACSLPWEGEADQRSRSNHGCDLRPVGAIC